MRIFLYILLIGISTLISCSGSPDPLYPRYTTFPDEKIVATQEISIDSAFFRYPYRVAVKDSIAVIMDLLLRFYLSGVEADRTVRKAWRGPRRNAFGRDVPVFCIGFSLDIGC